MEPHVFTDGEGGFSFGPRVWREVLKGENGDKARLYKDALAHRDEALRRTVVCRLDSRTKEADHWYAQARFLENMFAIPAGQEGAP